MSRILLVDDDASLLKLMSMRLRSQGYEVDTADSAEGALDRLRQQRADLVLSDLRMGGMDGLALFERIQSQWLGMPVIIMTAHGTIPDAIQATRSGVFSFLTKPIDKDELLVTIEHALSLTRPKQQHEWQSLIQTRNPQMEQLLIQASSIAAMEEKYGLQCINVFHAGDGNMHPLILFDSAQGQWPQAEAFGADILEECVRLGGTITGEHGVGIEKINGMCVQFSEAERAAFWGVKFAFDPSGLLNADKAIPTKNRCAEYGRMHIPRGAMKFPDLERF